MDPAETEEKKKVVARSYYCGSTLQSELRTKSRLQPGWYAGMGATWQAPPPRMILQSSEPSRLLAFNKYKCHDKAIRGRCSEISYG